ncbi:MAG: large conductance mechanosensitive channel protein MscL [Solirubrobacteraceae bacterium]|nr:large conductance mechanosensitive channel protein MscL [Solirubrobacteraceae bacterium]
MLKGFRDFLLRGNVVDLAVAVIIGTAFSAVVASLNKDVITQLIAAVGGVPDFSKETFSVNGTPIGYGKLITTIINFVIVAAVVYFAVIVPMNRALERFNKQDEVDETAATLTKDQELLIEIRDALKAGKTL